MHERRNADDIFQQAHCLQTPSPKTFSVSFCHTNSKFSEPSTNIIDEEKEYFQSMEHGQNKKTEIMLNGLHSDAISSRFLSKNVVETLSALQYSSFPFSKIIAPSFLPETEIGHKIIETFRYWIGGKGTIRRNDPAG